MGKQSASTGRTGVIVVDVQGDFTELKSGALAVPETDAPYIDAVEKTTRRYQEQGMPVYFTQDWHPADHVSFYSNNPEIHRKAFLISLSHPPVSMTSLLL